jgi:hypothetical protein
MAMIPFIRWHRESQWRDGTGAVVGEQNHLDAAILQLMNLSEA